MSPSNWTTRNQVPSQPPDFSRGMWLKTELLTFCFVKEKGLVEQDNAQDSFGPIVVEKLMVKGTQHLRLEY